MAIFSVSDRSMKDEDHVEAVLDRSFKINSYDIESIIQFLS